jgi:hypothetical protein
MECYRHAMLRNQTFDGRHENLKQATKLSRTYAALTEALEPRLFASGRASARVCDRDDSDRGHTPVRGAYDQNPAGEKCVSSPVNVLNGSSPCGNPVTAPE